MIVTKSVFPAQYRRRSRLLRLKPQKISPSCMTRIRLLSRPKQSRAFTVPRMSAIAVTASKAPLDISAASIEAALFCRNASHHETGNRSITARLPKHKQM